MHHVCSSVSCAGMWLDVSGTHGQYFMVPFVSACSMGGMRLRRGSERLDRTSAETRSRPAFPVLPEAPEEEKIPEDRVSCGREAHWLVHASHTWMVSHASLLREQPVHG